jgi:hypothetical protein
MSDYTEQEIYNELWLSVMGNGTVHFDSDVLDEDEDWLHYFSRLFHRIQTQGLMRTEALLRYHRLNQKSGLCQTCHETPPCGVLAPKGLDNKEV